MKYLLLLTALLLTFTSCQKNSDVRDIAEAQLLRTDREFSALSRKIGQVRAFKQYMAPNGLKLPLKGHPLNYQDYMRMEDNPTSTNTETLTWEPKFARASKAGDMGYTYGTYVYEYYDNRGELRQSTGYYVSVWEKFGTEWKYVFDAGNVAEGIE